MNESTYHTVTVSEIRAREDGEKNPWWFSTLCTILWCIGAVPVMLWPVIGGFALLGYGMAHDNKNAAGSSANLSRQDQVVSMSVCFAAVVYPIPVFISLIGLIRWHRNARRAIPLLVCVLVPLVYDLVLVMVVAVLIRGGP